MKLITVGFSTPKHSTVFSKLIRFFINKPYSHVYIKYYSDKYDRFLIYQSSGLKVNFCNINNFYRNNIVINEYIFKITEEQYVKIFQDSIDLVGESYGLKEVFGLGIVQLFNLFGKSINNPINEKAKWFCSELIGRLLLTIGFITQEEFNLNNLTPKDIEDIIKKRIIDG